ncbi:hypothetical protein AMTR_s00114p00124050, partial [Amborella trichopoda]
PCFTSAARPTVRTHKTQACAPTLVTCGGLTGVHTCVGAQGHPLRPSAKMIVTRSACAAHDVWDGQLEATRNTLFLYAAAASPCLCAASMPCFTSIAWLAMWPHFAVYNHGLTKSLCSFGRSKAAQPSAAACLKVRPWPHYVFVLHDLIVKPFYFRASTIIECEQP